MGLKQEEQITRYFEHRMSSAEEQNFLISLAASDELRIAFRSHIELIKAVRQDKDDLRSVAQIRNRTLTALGLSATALTPFIEQELLRSAKNQEQRIVDDAATAERAAVGRSWYAPLKSLIHTPKIALSTGLVLGFLSAAVLMNVTSHDPRVAGAVPGTQAQPSSESGIQLNTKPAERIISSEETIPAAKGLNTVARPASSLAQVSGQNRMMSSSGTAMSHDPKSTSVPEVTKSRQGMMDVNKAKIKSPNDSAKAR